MMEEQYKHALTLISTLHPAPSATAMIEMTGLMSKGRPVKRYFFYATLAAEYAMELCCTGYNTFVSVNPRHEMAAFESSVPYASALFLDIQPERIAIADAVAKLTRAGLYPSVSGWSGYGAHLYLLLAEPSDPHKTKLIWERLCKFVTSDSVHSINRIARVPGTLNRKRGSAAWCFLTDCNQARRYTIDEINKQLDIVGAGPARTPKDGIPVPIDPPIDWFELRKRLDEGTRDIIDTGEKNAYSEKQISRSEADWVVVCALIRAGAPDEAIHWIYETQPVGSMKYRDAGAHYLIKTIEAARRATAEPVEYSASSSRHRHKLPSGSAGDKRRR
jgi:hypothetical protein